MTDKVRLARQELLRVGLLGHVHASDAVPDLIMRSWRRSVGIGVDASSACQRFEEVDTESLLCSSAAPVFDRWQHQLADTGTTLLLSDRGGRIVARRTGDPGLRRLLDRAHVAEGFDYSEDSVGTNGLGTAMIEQRPVYIEGSQHYNEALEVLACAAAPVRTPTGTVIGSISLGCPSEIANPLMLTVTREIGQQIEDRLRTDYRPQDLAMAMSFMRYTNSGRPTLVLDEESLMANTPGLPYVNVTSHVTLWELLNAHNWSTDETTRLVLDEPAVEVSAHRVVDGPRAHFILHFSHLDKRTDQTDDKQSTPRSRSHTTPTHPTPAGPSDNHIVVIEGPPGSGRATAARDLHVTHRRAADLHEMTASQGLSLPWAVMGGLLAGGTDVLLRRAEKLSDTDAHDLACLLDQHRAATHAGNRTSLLLITTSTEQAPPAVRVTVASVGTTSRTVALSDMPERLPGLIKSVLNRLDPTSRFTLSPTALQSLLKWTWPGNITELVDVLSAVVNAAEAPVIERRHLPQHLQQAPPRRHLTMIESAERATIIKALNAATGNKSEAANLLGIGRSTLYRRIRQLGLDRGESSL